MDRLHIHTLRTHTHYLLLIDRLYYYTKLHFFFIKKILGKTISLSYEEILIKSNNFVVLKHTMLVKLDRNQLMMCRFYPSILLNYISIF